MPEQPTPSMVYDIIEACADPGCPLCRVTRRWAGRFMSGILYEEITDPHTRGRLKKSLGFCRDHAWQATEVGGMLISMSIIYRGLLKQLDDALGQASPSARKSWWRGKGGRDQNTRSADFTGLAAQAPCPACLYVGEMEQAALVALVEALPGNERLRTALSRPPAGLCLPHLRDALAVAPPDAFRFLQETTHTRLAGLQAELDEFIRKYDHRFRKEEWGEERDSWQRAIAWLVGGTSPDD